MSVEPTEGGAVHPMRRLSSYAKGHHKTVWAAASFSVFNKLFDLMPPALIGAAVDIVVEKEDSLIASFGIPNVTDQLIVLAILTVIVWGMESVFDYLLKLTWRNLAQTIQHELRVEAYDHIQQLDMDYFHGQSTGQLLSILNDDVNQLERFLDQGANDIIQVFTTAIVISATFFVLAPSVAWMAMLPVPFVLWGSFKYQSLLSARYADVRAKVGDLNTQLETNLLGISTIKSFTTEGYESERIQRLSQNYRESNRRAINLSSAFSPLIRMVIVVGFTATLIWGGLLVLDEALAVGTYSVLVFLTQRLLWPLTRLGQTFDLYQRALASTRRVLDLLLTPVRCAPGEGALRKDEVRGEIAFSEVTFAYKDREPLLKGFSLHVDAGQTLGVVGATGAGKSTLINLLLRFYAPQGGQITIDGRPLEQLRQEDVRRTVGLVSQSSFLFSGTVRDNIRYGTQDATHEQVVEAAKIAEAYDFISELPEGFDTVVGERGLTLSGGQRQRITIARALLTRAPILIFDEATSAVDNETEAALQRSLHAMSAQRTTIIIAHRLSTVRHADHIVVLDNGEIVEQGSHEALIAQQGLYTRYWRVQTGEVYQDPRAHGGAQQTP